MYAIKLDANNRPVSEGIDSIVPVTIIPKSVGIVGVEIPPGAFSFGFKRLPVKAEINVNETGSFPVDEGDQFGNFIELDTLKIDIKETSTESIVLIFIK